MSRRITSTFSCLLALALAASCSSDDKQTAPDEPAAGDGGEAPTGGTSGAPQGGTSGAAAGGVGGSGKAGSSGSANNGGTSADGGNDADGGESEQLGGGAPNAAGGGGSEPTGPVSACGAHKYDAGEPGCAICPAPPTPAQATTIDCDDFASAERDGDGNLLLALAAPEIHEPFGGDVTVDWSESGAPGSATVAWEYSWQLERFVFHLPIEARYADEITLGGWNFTDACGFSFSTGSLRVDWDGVESWQCGQDT